MEITKYFIVAILLCTVSDVFSHTYHSGPCPSVEPMPEFQMSKFLGVWYAIQKTSTASSCLIYNITSVEPGEYKVEQTSQHFILGLTPLKHHYSYTGEISVPDPDVPGKMKVKFPLNVAGSSSFTVFMTDYDTFAGIYTCQKLGFVHRQSATILSRSKTLDKIFIDKLRNRLASSLVDPFELNIIDQRGCPKNESGVNIHIDDETFSSHNVANVFRKAGEKIGDGVEFVVDAGKKAYHNIKSDENSSEKYRDGTLRAISPPTRETEAEWIRV